jgi:hypothetical protein
VAQGAHHASQLALRALARQCGHQTDDPWHGLRPNSEG